VLPFTNCINISVCKSYDNVTTGTSAGVNSFEYSTRIIGCSTSGNTTVSGVNTGYYICKSVQQCKSSGDTVSYGTGGSQSYADSGTTNPCADTAAGGYNS
jgi:hypothetical protein